MAVSFVSRIPTGWLQQCEDLEDTDSLRLIFDIVKSFIMLNDTNIMELLFSEDYVMDMVRLAFDCVYKKT